MATVRPDDGDLLVALSRREKLGAMHGDIRGPLSAVEDVAVTHKPFVCGSSTGAVLRPNP